MTPDEDAALHSSSRPKAPWAQVIATTVQTGLLVVALYGLFISNAGDRLFDVLQGDVETAQKELAATQSAKLNIESVLQDERQRLLEVRQAQNEVEAKTKGLNLALSESKQALGLTEDRLVRAQDTVDSLSDALSVTRPAAMNARCRALLTQLSPYMALEMRYRLLPIFRWNEFSRVHGRQSFDSWDELIEKYERWTARKEQNDLVAAEFFSQTDRTITVEMEVKKTLASQVGRRGWAKEASDDPNAFSPSLSGIDNVRNKEQNLESYLRLGDKSDDIRSLLSEERLEQADKEYAIFKTELRQQIGPFASLFDEYVRQSEITAADSSEAVARLVMKQLIQTKNARNARAALVGVCYPNSPWQLFYPDL